MIPPGALRGLSASPYLLLTLTTAMWGANAVAARLAVGEVSPMALTCLRWLTVILALSLLAGRRLAADLRAARPHWRFIVLCGAFGFTAFNAIFYLAGHTTSAINIGLIQGITPALVLAGGVVVDRAPVRPLQVAGLLLTLAGVLVATSRGDPDVLRHLAFNAGDVWMIVASILYAGYSLALRRRPPIPPLAFFVAVAAAAFLTSVPLLLLEVAGGGAIWPTPLGWAIVAFVGIGPSLVGQLFYMRGIELIGPGRASIFMNLIPIFAAFLGILIVGERFGLYHAAALALVLGGILAVQRGGRGMTGGGG